MDIMQAVKKSGKDMLKCAAVKHGVLVYGPGLIITLLPDGFVLMDSRSGKLIYRRLI